MTVGRKQVPQSDARRKAASVGGASEPRGQAKDEGRASAYPGARAYRPERISSHEGPEAPTSVRHSQRAARAPVAVRAGDSVAPPEPTREPRAVDGHPLDRQEDTNPGLGSIRGMGFPRRGNSGDFDSDATVMGAGDEALCGEDVASGPVSAVPASAERPRGVSDRDAATRLAPVVVSERERRAARAALELHASAKPGTVRGLGGFSVAPALDAALNAHDAAGGRDALLPAASVASPVESPLADDSETSSMDWAAQGYFERDPESVARPPKRWVVPLVGVVLLVAAGVLVFAAVQRFFEKRAAEQAGHSAAPAMAVVDPARANPTVPGAPLVGAKSEQGVRSGPASVGAVLPLAQAPSADVSTGTKSRTGSNGGVESSTSPGVARGNSEDDSERTGAASRLRRGQVRPQRRAATPPPQAPAPKRVPDEPLF